MNEKNTYIYTRREKKSLRWGEQKLNHNSIRCAYNKQLYLITVQLLTLQFFRNQKSVNESNVCLVYLSTTT